MVRSLGCSRAVSAGCLDDQAHRLLDRNAHDPVRAIDPAEPVQLLRLRARARTAGRPRSRTAPEARPRPRSSTRSRRSPKRPDGPQLALAPAQQRVGPDDQRRAHEQREHQRAADQIGARDATPAPREAARLAVASRWRSSAVVLERALVGGRSRRGQRVAPLRARPRTRPRGRPRTATPRDRASGTAASVGAARGRDQPVDVDVVRDQQPDRDDAQRTARAA